MTKKYTRILGIDPGSVVTGFGIIESDGQRSIHLAHGNIKLVGKDFTQRLGNVFSRISDVLDEWQPEECAIENVFMNKNAMSALKLGQARGAAIAAVVSRGVSVAEYSPRLIKQTVTGTGGADKAQVQHMIRILLNIREEVPGDAADGLAIALCHAHSRTAARVAGGDVT